VEPDVTGLFYRQLEEYLRAEDRKVRGAVSGSTQREMGFTDFAPNDRSLTSAQTHAYIDYANRPTTGDPKDTWNSLTLNQTGTVNIQGYMTWLCNNGYFKKDSSQCASGGATP